MINAHGVPNRVNMWLRRNLTTTLTSLVHVGITSSCHAPNPGPTRLADPNRFPGFETQDWDSLPEIFFFFKANWHLWVWPTSYNRVKRTTTGVVSIKIYTHILSPFYKYKTVLLQLQIRARNLHVVNPYKCVGPAVCRCLLMSSPVPTRIKNPC